MPATPIIALDVPRTQDALAIVDQLGDRCRFYKIGHELFTAEGPRVVRDVRARGCEVFLDLKFHDIPNTVAGGVRNAARLGVRLVTVHATGGAAMIRAAVDAAGESCGVLAVTVLTSLAVHDAANAWGRDESIDLTTEVLRLSDLSASAGAHGVVCSGREAAPVHARFGERLAILVPGVRAAGGAAQDQARVVTPRAASEAGARYIVVGRMVTAAEDRAAAMDELLHELA
jgi:orotidine-5'-phosphate decarboxylase